MNIIKATVHETSSRALEVLKTFEVGQALLESNGGRGGVSASVMVIVCAVI